MNPPLWAVPAACIGVLLGPMLSAWAEQASQSTRPGTMPQRRGGIVPTRMVAAVSAVTGLLFGLVALRYAGSATWPAWSWLAATGVVLATVDIQHRRLPYRETAAMTVGGAVALAGAAAVESRWTSFLTAILSAAAVLAITSAVQLLWPQHTGGGDTLLYGALALYLGWFGIPGLLRGMLFATGLTALVALVVWGRRRQRTATFPAGPTLLAGTLIEVLLE